MTFTITISPFLFSFLLKLSFIAIFISSVVVIVNAILSAKALGGELGRGLKKIAAGTIAHIILIFTFFTLEKGSEGILTEEQVRLFFMITGIFGSILLMLGYFQMYRISKKLKLF
ncbi:MAG: hypothetical protein RI947_448 [Candidatus Parcubacteria bacterium]|jgi:hypothetical protein